MSGTWVFDKRPLNDVMRLNKPSGYKFDVYKVTSPDSGEVYWVQVVRGASGMGEKLKAPIVLCDCPVGKFQALLIVLGLEDFICKHGQALLAYLKTQK
jgi:hypothetical protein